MQNIYDCGGSGRNGRGPNDKMLLGSDSVSWLELEQHAAGYISCKLGGSDNLNKAFE